MTEKSTAYRGSKIQVVLAFSWGKRETRGTSIDS